MPFYHATIRSGLLDEGGRTAFANDVVDVHCSVTGAPRSFVHVMYTEAGDGHFADGVSAAINGTIRAGRTDEQKTEITSRLAAALAGHAGVDTSSVQAITRDIPASHTMEGGALLPEPGSADEERWKAS